MTIHWIKDANVGPTQVSTHCGMEGKRQWRDRSDLFRTSMARDFTAVRGQDAVECKNCLRSAKRISETCFTNPRTRVSIGQPRCSHNLTDCVTCATGAYQN